MNIQLNRKTLLDALRFGGMVAGKCKTISILDYCKVAVKNGKMVVTSTDTEITVAKKVEIISCNVEHAEFCVVPSDLVPTLGTIRDENVSLEVNENVCTLVHSRGVAKVACLSSEDFPQNSNGGDKTTFSMDASRLREWLDTAKNFVANDPLRPNINGMYLAVEDGEVWCCASDSHKMYMDGYKDVSFGGMNFGIIIAPKVFGYANPLLDGYANVTVYIDENSVSFVTSDTKITSRLIVGNYPKVRQLVPRVHPILVEVNTMDFVDSVSRMKLFADKAKPRAVMHFSPDGIKFSSFDLLSNKSCEDSCDVLMYEGDEIEMCTKIENLSALVSKIDSETFCIGMSEPQKPIIMYEADNKNKILFTMPLVKK